tara:strand:+ start:611 stop:1354 length:744 start_codon:yes stop_codon:yes gene_type:complete
MVKFKLNTTRNYSPNFDTKKRKINEIKYIIFHYTGMKNEKVSLNKLTSLKSKVSCHYFVKNNGKIITVIPDLYISWHAGVSKWKKNYLLNKSSIGIEISNPGHNINYKKFSDNQIKSIIKLSKFLIKKYKINRKNILGHSDVAPERKKDPGEKFPWKYLSKKKIGYWHNLDERNLIKKRRVKIFHSDKNKFIRNLFKIGYRRNNNLDFAKYSKLLTKAFQRRFRPELINGIIDKECLIISKKLLKIN